MYMDYCQFEMFGVQPIPAIAEFCQNSYESDNYIRSSLLYA